MSNKSGWIRAGLYVALLAFSFILFVLSCARINYTLHLARTDPLNGGRPFYDPVIPELIATTLITMAWSIIMLVLFFINPSNIRLLRRYGEELIGLVILWFLWIGGAASASTIWGTLSFCQEFQTCQILSALEAFAWFGWLTLIALIVSSIVAVVRSRNSGKGRGFGEPIPSRSGVGNDWPGLGPRKEGSVISHSSAGRVGSMA